MSKRKPKPVEAVHVRTLDVLPEKEFTLTVTFKEDGESYTFNCRRMTYEDHQTTGRLIIDPQPVQNGLDDLKRPIYDTNSPTYRSALIAASDRRLFLRMTRFLLLDYPHDTIEENADYLAENLEYPIAQAIGRAMLDSTQGGQIDIAATAATFHPNGLSEDASSDTDGLDTG